MANEVRIDVTSRDRTGAGFRSARQNAEGFGKSVGRIGEIAQGILAAQFFDRIGERASRALGEARDASSNLGESVNAVNVTFGAAADGIHQLGQTSAESMGLSQRAFNDAAVRFSNFADVIAGPGGNSAKIIEDITGRTSDFASVMNLDVGEAMRVMQSGLAGETEVMRRYGIDVSAATVQTFAYSQGIAETGAELTEAEKIQARYGLIMGQTARMQGDFANTSKELANSQRILDAEVENAQATIGQLMVPSLAALNNVLIPMVQAFTDAPGPVQALVGSMVILGGGIVAVTSKIAPMIVAAKTAGLTMETFATKARAATLALGAVGAILAGVSWALSRNAEASEEAARKTDAYVKSVEGFGNLDTEEKLRRLNAELERIAPIEEGKQQWDAYGVNAKIAGNAADALRGRIEQLSSELPGATTAASEQALSMGELAGTTEHADKALADYLDTQRRAIDPVFNLMSAIGDVDAAQRSYNQAVEDHGPKSKEAAGAAVNLAQKVAALEQAALDGELSFDEFNAKLREWVQQGRITEEQADAIRGRVKAARGEAEAFDRRYRPRIEVQAFNLLPTLERIRSLKAQLDAIDDRHVSFTVAGVTKGTGLSATAHGGIVGAARPMQAGGIAGLTPVLKDERGGEITLLPNGSIVIPHGMSQALLAGAFASPSPVVLELRSSGSAVDDMLLELLRRAIKIRGGDVQLVLGGR